jgi:hypothetical protein
MEPTKMINCLKVSLKEVKDARYTRIDLINGLKNICILKSIKSINQLGSSLRWIVCFSDENIFKGLIGQKIKVKDQEVYLDDANNNDVYVTFRVSWLIPDFPLDLLRKKFSTFGEVVELKEEHMKEEGCEHILTGNVQVKMKFKKAEMSRIGEIIGIKKFKEFRILITRAGQKIGCFHCLDRGHVKRDCPIAQNICKKCNKKGHKDDECNAAKVVQYFNDMDEEEDDEEETPIVTPVENQVNEINEADKTVEKKVENGEKSNLVEMVEEGTVVKANKKSKRNASELSPNGDQEREHKKLNEDSGDELSDSEGGGNDSYLNSNSP